MSRQRKNSKKQQKKGKGTTIQQINDTKTNNVSPVIAALREKKVDKKSFWNNFVKALGVEPRPDNQIRGKSGLYHNLLGIGVNDKQNRLILISDTPSAEHAALMQVDVQATLTDTNVVIARPIAFDMVKPIKAIVDAYGSTIIDKVAVEQFGSMMSAIRETQNGDVSGIIESIFGETLVNATTAFVHTPISAYSQFLQVIGQLSLIDWPEIVEDTDKLRIDLTEFIEVNVIDQDRQYGICPIPLYNFSEGQMDTILEPANVDDSVSVIEELGIYKYFFPDPEEVGLGIVDRGITDIVKMQEALVASPKMGHPYRDGEIFTGMHAKHLVEQLIDKGTLKEAEIMEITSEGREIRAKVISQPKEGFIIKLVRAFGINIHFNFPR